MPSYAIYPTFPAHAIHIFSAVIHFWNSYYKFEEILPAKRACEQINPKNNSLFIWRCAWKNIYGVREK